MNAKRREVLKSIAAAGVAAPIAAAAHAGDGARSGSPGAASPHRQRVLPVTAGHPLDAAFVRGVERATAGTTATLLPPHAIGDRNPAALTALRASAAGEATAIVGLTDSATAMLVLDRIRDAGGSVLAMSHHRLSAEAGAAGWAARIGELAVAQAHSQPALLAGAADDGAAGTAYAPDGISYMSFTCII